VEVEEIAVSGPIGSDDSNAPSPSSGASEWRRVLVIGLTTACAAMAFLAFGASLGRYWTVLLTVPAAITAALGMRGRPIPDAPMPTLGVVALATATLLFSFVALAFVAWSLYWLVRGPLYFVETLANVGLAAERIGWWFSLALLSLLLLAYAPSAARKLAAALYPAAGLHSRYFDATRFERSALLMRAGGAIAIVAALIVIAYTADLPGEDLGTTLLFSLVAVGSLFATPETGLRADAPAEEDVENVTYSLRKRGWTVLQTPRTGDEGIDPLLAEVDLFAYRETTSILVDVSRANGYATTQWAACAGLVTAAQALPSTELPPGIDVVEPVMVLVDSAIEPALARFARRHSVSVVVLDMKDQSISVAASDRLYEELTAIGELAVTGPARTREGVRDRAQRWAS
jgi:hypothetical protein